MGAVGDSASNTGFDRLMHFLDEHDVEYEMLHHERDFRALTAAHDTHTPANEFAKTVFVRVEGEPAIAVVPADHGVSLRKLRRACGGASVTLMTEAETKKLCPDCEVGAAPPFGNLYGLPVYVSAALSSEREITFNGGTHDKAFRMKYRDYERLANPEVVPLVRDE